MNDFKKQASQKLKSRAGETIGETLVSLLISALALVMLAGAISSTAKMITASDKQMGKYYEGDSKLVEKNNGDSTLGLTITGTGTQSATETRVVNYYSNTAFANIPVVAYKVP